MEKRIHRVIWPRFWLRPYSVAVCSFEEFSKAMDECIRCESMNLSDWKSDCENHCRHRKIMDRKSNRNSIHRLLSRRSIIHRASSTLQGYGGSRSLRWTVLKQTGRVWHKMTFRKAVFAEEAEDNGTQDPLNLEWISCVFKEFWNSGGHSRGRSNAERFCGESWRNLNKKQFITPLF